MTLWVVSGVFLGAGLLVTVILVILVTRLSRGERDRPKDPGDAIADARARLDDPADGVIPLTTTFPPANWTHQDLADHLGSKGLAVVIRRDPGLRSPHGEGVWFEDTRDLKRGGARKGRVRVFLCRSPRDAARQVAVMRPEVWLPYAAGNFAIGHDSTDNPTDEDMDFASQLKQRGFF
jgi:hypothetical protein